jgi:dolichol-phosphate mannosyltransferase
MIFFLIPTYNEFDNIPLLAENFRKLALKEDFKVIFSDDGSTDRTKEQVSTHFSFCDHVFIEAVQNAGPGKAFDTGFQWILNQSQSDSDKILTMEADSTGDFQLVYDMLVLNEHGYNLVLASVYAQGGGFENTTFIRKMLSFWANLLFRSVFNIKVLTISSFYRCYSVDLMRKIARNNPEIIREQGFICMLEILLKAIACEARIVELPLQLKSGNRIGKSKMKIFKNGVSYMKFLVKWKWGRRKSA